MSKQFCLVLATALSAWSVQRATAQVTAADIGTGLPPSTLGGYSMSPFDPGNVQGESGYACEQNGFWDGGNSVWATWGQNYTGNVYVLDSGQGETLTLFLSGQTEAVDFYEEPNEYQDFSMTATDSSGDSATTIVNGLFGSSGVGFYEDAPNGDYLAKITVTCDDPYGFAIGEFGIDGGTLSAAAGASVGDATGTLALAGMGLGGLMLFARQRAFRA